MSKLIAVLVLCAASAACAQESDGGRAASGKETPTEQIRREVGGTVKKGVERIQQVEKGVRGKDGPAAASAKPPTPEELAKAFDVQGTVKRPSAAFVTLEREGLPDASLSVRDRTVVMVDGKQVAAQELPEGAVVRAKFQLEGEEPVALRIEARAEGATRK